MLQGGNPLTVGVGIVIEVIRKNNSDYDPENVGGPDSIPTTYDPIYLGTLLRLFANHVPDFMALTRNSTHTVVEGNKIRRVERGQLNSPWGAKIEPLGFDRFKTCELMAELLHCSNMGLLNEPGSEQYVRHRDVEREKLTSMLYSSRGDTFSVDNYNTTADSVNGSTYEYGFPEDPKTFEFTSTGDEDGFEDVSSSGVLVEGGKDVEEQEGGEETTTSSKDSEANRTKGVFSQVFPPPKPNDDRKERTSEDQPRPSGIESPTTSLINQFGKIKLDDEKPSENTSGNQNSTNSSKEQGGPAPTSSHLEDIPAPLFVAKPQAESTTPDTSIENTSVAEAAPETSATGFESGSPIDELARQCIQIDINGQPVVGDYLKIMFVKNQVVPIILVSRQLM